MQRFDIYNAQTQWNGCSDVRPWLIVEIGSAELLGCFPIASQCYGGNCFPIECGDPDFAASGLSKSCFIHDSHIIEISAGQIGRYCGRLQRQLLADFLEFSGLT